VSERDVINTAIAEAGGHEEGLRAVFYTIVNRAARDGKTPAQVVKQRNQYEGYSNPGPASVKAQSDPKVRAKAEQIWQQVQARAIPDPTEGGFNFRAEAASKGLEAPNGTVNINGNVFAKGSGAPKTALSAINAVAPIPMPRPNVAEAYAPSSNVKAISVNPNGQPASLVDALSAKYSAVRPTSTADAGGIYKGFNLPTATPLPGTPLTSHSVRTVQINPTTGNPYTGQELAQQAANTAAARMRGSMPAGRTANIPAVPQLVSVKSSANQVPPPKVTFTTGNPVPSIVPSSASGSIKTNAQAGNVGLPPGVVPKQAAADLARVSALQSSRPAPPSSYGSAFTGGFGSPAFAPPVAATVPGPARTLAANKDTSRLSTSLPPMAYGSINPTAPGVAAINTATISLPRPRPDIQLPRIPVRPPAAMPLTQFNTVNPTSQIMPRMSSGFNSSPIGHVASLLQGQPIQGGLLAALFNQGANTNTPAPPSVPQSPPAIPASVHAALMAQQSPDQRGQAALRASGMLDSFGMIR